MSVSEGSLSECVERERERGSVLLPTWERPQALLSSGRKVAGRSGVGAEGTAVQTAVQGVGGPLLGVGAPP